MRKSIFLALMFVLVTGVPVSAQIFLEQGKLTYQISPGDRITEALSVHNTSDRPLELRIYLEDF